MANIKIEKPLKYQRRLGLHADIRNLLLAVAHEKNPYFARILSFEGFKRGLNVEQYKLVFDINRVPVLSPSM